MNDDRFLKDWLRDATRGDSDPEASADRVLARVTEIRQRSRWWPWLPVSRTRPRPTDDDRPPTVSGRTRLMLSPVKAITVGALVFAIGGAFLIAQPFDQQGSVPGAEQGAEPPAPVKVTADYIRLDCEPGSGGTEPTFEEDGLISRGYGGSCTAYHEWSDPRLQGTETYIVNGVDYWDDSELYIGHYVHNIVTDVGAWRMRPQFRFEDADGIRHFSGTWVLDGEGAYEGLSVVLAKDESTSTPLSGYIISTDLVPPAPDGASTK